MGPSSLELPQTMHCNYEVLGMTGANVSLMPEAAVSMTYRIYIRFGASNKPFLENDMI